jgi:hypothetical protein
MPKFDHVGAESTVSSILDQVPMDHVTVTASRTNYATNSARRESHSTHRCDADALRTTHSRWIVQGVSQPFPDGSDPAKG